MSGFVKICSAILKLLHAQMDRHVVAERCMLQLLAADTPKLILARSCNVSVVISHYYMRELIVWVSLVGGPPLWSSGQEFLATDLEVPGLIPGATRFFLRSSGSGTGSTQPRDDN
jgi:hypothetical protein